MMRTIFIAFLALGLALAGFAVHMAQNYIGQTQAKLVQEQKLRAKTGPLVEVYAVNKPLNYGDPLTKDDLQLVYLQESALPDGVFKSEEEVFPEGLDKPRFVLRQIEKFEPVLAVKVTAPGEAAGLTGMLAEGERAFTIKFDDTSGASRYLQPGNRVDVYWTGRMQDGQEMTQLIETTLAIIAVDRPASKDKEKAADSFAVPRAMTVAATPEQVARLAQAQATGQLSVSLVAQNDGTPSTERRRIEVDANTLLGIEQQVQAPVVMNKVCTVRTRKGDNVMTVARRYGVSATSVAEWNNLNINSPLKAGQQLALEHPLARLHQRQGLGPGMLAKRQVQARRQRLHGDAEGGRAVLVGGGMDAAAKMREVEHCRLPGSDAPVHQAKSGGPGFGPAPVVQRQCLGREGDAVLRAGLQAFAAANAGIAQHAMDLPVGADDGVGRAGAEATRAAGALGGVDARQHGRGERTGVQRHAEQFGQALGQRGPAGRAAGDRGAALDQGVGRRTATRIAALPALAAGQQRLDFLDQRVLLRNRQIARRQTEAAAEQQAHQCKNQNCVQHCSSFASLAGGVRFRSGRRSP